MRARGTNFSYSTSDFDRKAGGEPEGAEPVFSRRTIQALLDSVGPLLPASDLAELATRLNSHSESLAAIWEISVCYGLSRIGGVSYQVVLPSGKKPDVAFTPQGSPTTLFVADVTTVSDDGYHEENQVDAFSRDFATIVQRFGLDPSKFGFQIESTKIGNRVWLLIPEPNDRLESLKRYLGPFLRQLNDDSSAKREFAIAEPDFAITITYDPLQRYMTYGHRMYNQARSINQNPLWNRLDKKAKQLRTATGITGVIVCDGGCSVLSGNAGRDIGAFSADDIIRKFLRTSSSVDFVCAITSKRKPGMSRDCQFISHIWTRDAAVRPQIEPILNGMLASLPSPIFDAQNAAIQAAQKTFNSGARTDFSFGISGDRILSVSMSARRLLEILAGKYSPSDIDEICGGLVEPNVSGFPNPFKRALANGQLITDVSVESIGGRDDDRIVIKFGQPDPAVSAFRVKLGI
ncbi:hypothetical protein ACVIGB_002534 [Bradyrhizobium sp. USDA 4341]